MAYERKTVDIHVSNRLRTVLTYFQDESEYAKLLLKGRINKELLVDEPINYLCISKEDSNRISYVNDKRKERIDELKDDIWTSKYRYHCKPGGFLNKVFKDVKETEIEKFATMFRSFSVDVNYEWKVVAGDEIQNYYHYSKHQNGNGTLGVSCMKYDQCRNWLKIYADNDMISMLIMLEPRRDRVIGRALLWDLGDEKIMDRVYTNYDEQYSALFTYWAKQNGYAHKQQNNWFNTIKFRENGETVEKQLEVQLQNWHYGAYPYLDTFKWMDVEQGKLFNYRPGYFENNNYDKYRALVSPHGTYDRPDTIKFDEIERIYSYAGDVTLVDGVQTNVRNCQFSEVYDRYLLTRDSVYREDISSYVYKDDTKNDKDAIQKRLDYYESRRKQREERERLEREMQEARRRGRRDPFTVLLNDRIFDPEFYRVPEPEVEVPVEVAVDLPADAPVEAVEAANEVLNEAAEMVEEVGRINDEEIVLNPMEDTVATITEDANQLLEEVGAALDEVELPVEERGEAQPEPDNFQIYGWDYRARPLRIRRG